MAADPDTKQAGLPSTGATEFAKLFAMLKMPAVPDIAAFIDINKRNMEALAAANRVAFEGAQAVMRRHMEIMQSSLTEVTEGVRAITAVEAPQAKAAKQAELVKQTYGHGIANVKELADLIQRANSEAINVLNRRFAEAMDEVKALAEKPR
jgi:phasin family protein